MIFRWLLFVLAAAALTGCATPERTVLSSERPFSFPSDAFAYANELVWEYQFDQASGKMYTQRREPPPNYTLHCFVVARSARQFFQHARFVPSEPKATPAVYRHLIQQLLARSPRESPLAREKIVIPGYTNLRAFSQDYEALLKEECGGAWQSYLQRGNWRMIFPFTRRHQERTAERLVKSLRQNDAPVVHAVRFPALTINHALLLFDFTESEKAIQFLVYDPNSPEAPTTLTYRRDQKTFEFPPNKYFAGGPVSVYQIYRGAIY